MTVVGKLLNGTNLSRDIGFQAIQSAIVDPGVLKNYESECEVTTNAVAKGRAFVEVTRTTLTPNETFLIPIDITAVETIDTSGTGYVIIRVDDDAVDDGSANSADGSDIATIEVVASLPSRNYLLLATLASGTITDARVYSELSDDIQKSPVFYDEDEEATDSYVITVPGVRELVDGMEFTFKANTTNAGASALEVIGDNGTLGSKAIKKKFNADTDDGDIEDGQIVVVRYDATNDWMQMMSTPSTITSFTVADQATAEEGTDNADLMTSLRVAQAIEAQRVFGGDGSDGDLVVSSDTTLNPSYKVFNYDNLTIDVGQTLDFGSNFQNKVVHIKVRNDCEINGTLSLKGAGSTGGNGGTNTNNGNDGSVVHTDCLDSGSHQGQNGVAGGAGGVGGDAWTTTGIASIYCTQSKRLIYVVPGVGGAGGAGGNGNAGGVTAAGVGGNIGAVPTAGATGANAAGAGYGGGGGGGGAGGGALILEVCGDLTLGASHLIDVSGQDGALGGNGGAATGTGHGGGGGGGGGGGSGGMACILYRGTLTGTPNIDISGGDGGNGGNAGAGLTGAGSTNGSGGGGGGGGYSGAGGNAGSGSTGAGTNGSAGSAGGGGGGGAGFAGGGYSGGTGGAGSSTSGKYIIEKNVSFG